MADLLAQLENETALAVDTEFFRETTYYPHLGLIQIAGENIVACIDPLAFDAGEALRKIFCNRAITKIFHSCSQDMEVLFHHYGFVPCPVHDTQIAEALLSTHEQIGYARLVENELGVQLAKTQTRTNWVKRPLSRKQLDYAGDDVRYLYRLYKQLLDKLKTAGRYHWFEEDCSRLCAANDNADQLAAQFSVEESTLWKRVKGSNKYSGVKLAIIQAVARWRENIAIETDTTRRRVLHDEAILQLAMQPPQTPGALDHLRNNRFALTTQQIEQLLACIQQAEQSTASQWPLNTRQRPTAEQKAQLSTLQNILTQRASELGISAGVLCARKNLEKLIAGQTDLPVMQGWRLDCVGKALQEHLPGRAVTESATGENRPNLTD